MFFLSISIAYDHVSTVILSNKVSSSSSMSALYKEFSFIFVYLKFNLLIIILTHVYISAVLCPSVTVDHASVFASISPQDGGRYTVGCRLDIVCNYGYMTNNSKQLECLPSGVWADDIPLCTGWWIRGHLCVTYHFFSGNPHPRNNNIVEPYTFVTLFLEKFPSPSALRNA